MLLFPSVVSASQNHLENYFPSMFFSGISTSQNSINNQCVEFSPHSALFNFFSLSFYALINVEMWNKICHCLHFTVTLIADLFFVREIHYSFWIEIDQSQESLLPWKRKPQENELCSSHWLPWSIVISVIESFSPHTQSTCIFYIITFGNKEYCFIPTPLC